MVPPTRMKRCSCSTRKSLICMFMGISPTSSMNSVPLSASSKKADLLSRGACEGAFLPEELVFEEMLGNRGRVYGDERPFAAVPVHVVGHDLLAHARFPEQEQAASVAETTLARSRHMRNERLLPHSSSRSSCAIW